MLNTVALNVSGVATYSITTLTVGPHTITALYVGDGNYASARSNSATQTVTAADFSLAANPASIMIPRGSSGQITITATELGSFNTAVTLTCGSLPQYASCVFSPSAMSWSGGTASSTLTVSTTYAGASAQLKHRMMWLAVFTFGLPGLLLFGGRKQLTQRRVLASLLLMMAMTMVLGLGACGTNSGALETPKANYTIPVTATGGTTSHTVTLTVTVQ